MSEFRSLVRRAAKQLGERLLGNSASTRVLGSLMRPRLLVVAFHNVIPDAEEPKGDRSLHIRLARFRELLDWLPDFFEVVPLATIVRDGPPSTDRPRIAITFDDAYAGAMELGIGELVRRGLPATVFVISDMRAAQTFWWDALAHPKEGLSKEIREELLTSTAGREMSIRALARDHSWKYRELGGPYVASTWKQLLEASRLEGIEVAHHTRTHANAALLSREELLDELQAGRRELEQRVPEARPWLAWPYGRSSARARAVAMESGYEAAFRIDGGTWRVSDPPPPRFRLPRLNVPAGLTPDGLRLRTVGLLGR